MSDEVFSEQEIVTRLENELPNWHFEGGWIQRKYETSGWKSTLMLINMIGHLAEAAWHHPEISASYGYVIVKLMNHAANGITNKDFELAGKIEDVLMWQPGGDDESALDGTPQDPRFEYIKYD